MLFKDRINTKYPISNSLSLLILTVIICCNFQLGIAGENIPDTKESETCDKNLDAWLKCNNPRIIKYLLNLTKKDINKKIKGVMLTDGTEEMKDYIFIGEAKIQEGIHLYIFRKKMQLLAYAWIDKDGIVLPIPECRNRPEEDIFESAYVLSGDVYTWKAMQSDDGVVKIMCVENDWLRAAGVKG